MTLTQTILKSLPATLPELCAVLEHPVKRVNAMLFKLSRLGRVRRSDRQGMRYGKRGPKPGIWERI